MNLKRVLCMIGRQISLIRPFMGMRSGHKKGHTHPILQVQHFSFIRIMF